MAKNLKLHVKNTQLAEAINLKGLKAKLSRKKGDAQEDLLPQLPEEALSVEAEEPSIEEVSLAPVEIQEKIEIPIPVEEVVLETVQQVPEPQVVEPEVVVEPPSVPPVQEVSVVAAEVRKESEVLQETLPPRPQIEVKPVKPPEKPPVRSPEKPLVRSVEKPPMRVGERPLVRAVERPPMRVGERPPMRVGDRLPVTPTFKKRVETPKETGPRVVVSSLRNTVEKLGPVLDKEIPKKPPRKEPLPAPRTEKAPYGPLKQKEKEPVLRDASKTGEQKKSGDTSGSKQASPRNAEKVPPKTPEDLERAAAKRAEGESARKGKPKTEEVKYKPLKKGEPLTFDSRRRHGVVVEEEDDERGWRKRRFKSKAHLIQVPEVMRPTKVSVRLPISVKDLAAEMKLKASELISKLFMQGIVVTLNDLLGEELVVQLLGHELGCEISIDTREEERVRITGKTIAEEVTAENSVDLQYRPPVVAFMGHVDHGKTSLIDAIRKSNRAQYEVGAITQHIGAFMCQTCRGLLTIIDTPGHEAFSAMRIRGAGVTDIVVLVIAGDEGIQVQTVEALKQARDANAMIVVAINKCDKPAFDQDRVFRQLADQGLLPESWGGTTVTVPCSALTHKGIPELLEMIALQAEVLELKANPRARARGTVIESEMNKGQGPLATVLVQNGTLRLGDCVVFGATWARVKSMRDEGNKELFEVGPSTPARITGISGVPAAGEEFIVVKDEKEAKDIAEARREGQRQIAFQAKKKISLENMMEKASGTAAKKVLTLIIRADVQGSLEAVKNALLKIESNKVELNIIAQGVGEVSESDLQLGFVSKALIIGFHIGIEAHADPMVKELGVQVRLFDIIYHAQDEVKALMKGLLDKIPEEREKGKAEVRALFKSSQLGTIAGCQVIDGSVTRNSMIRVRRAGNVEWTGPVSSLKRFKEDVKEAAKGAECGIVLQGYSVCQVGDILEAYEVIYLEQDL